MKECKYILPSPLFAEEPCFNWIDEEIKQARKRNLRAITLKMNSLSDEDMIQKLYEAARAYVQIKLIKRGVFCMFSDHMKFKKPVKAISIVDEYSNMHGMGIS